MIANMPAREILRTKDVYPDGTIREMVVWELPGPVPGSPHRFKYRLFFGVPGERLIGYDNERGKGDHRHIGRREERYEFVSAVKLVDDFDADIARWRAKQESSHRRGSAGREDHG